ncbi:MAG: DUF3782 domain-containing protein, partial [Candidatus Calescibacterium sp.]|nr:DUF3782 domain-containing protein [Candidatus Calescibacterium sp.]
EEQNKRIEEILKEIRELRRKYDVGIGSIGARWGIMAETSFRDAIKGILEEDFPVKVERYLKFDNEGNVFGKPDQVELDVIIKDGKIIIAEIKSSMSKADVFILKKKIDFYEKKEKKKANRVLIISPMVDQKAWELAKELGFEVYSYPEDINKI